MVVVVHLNCWLCCSYASSQVIHATAKDMTIFQLDSVRHWALELLDDPRTEAIHVGVILSSLVLDGVCVSTESKSSLLNSCRCHKWHCLCLIENVHEWLVI